MQRRRKTPPVVIAIKREGRAFPIVVTDFNKASVQTVLDVEPDAKPGSYRLVVGAGDRPMTSNEVKYVYFQGNRNAQGKFDRLRFAEIFLMKGKWADYILLSGEISPYSTGWSSPGATRTSRAGAGSSANPVRRAGRIKSLSTNCR